MAAFKGTKNKNDSADTFKATNRKSYDSNIIYEWEEKNKEALDILNNYTERINKNEWLSDEDRKAYRKALDTYISTSNELRGINKTFGDGYSDEDEQKWTDSIASMNKGYDDISSYYSQFSKEEDYNRWYDNYKKSEEFKSVLTADDFEEYSKMGASIKNPTPQEAEPDIILFGQPVGGKKVGNVVTYSRDNADSLGFGEANGGSSYTGAKYLYAFMEDDEVNVYNYYLGKGDTKTAEEYLASIEDTLKQRHAGQMVENVGDNKALSMIFAAGAGLEQFATGIRNIDNYITGAEADSATATQYASSEIRSNLDGFWGGAYDVINTTTNMLPSVLLGTVTGGASGLAAMGASAVGNAYAEMKNLGYSDWQSRGYATLVGASEVALQSLLGGISKLGGKFSLNSGITKLVSGLDNAVARIAIKVPLNMASEGLEEGIQTALEPAFKALVTGEEYEAAEWGDIMYSALLGALSAGVMEGAPTIAGEAYRSHSAKKEFGTPNATATLVNQGLEFDEGTEARGFAEKYNAQLKEGKSLNGTQLANLYEASESQHIADDTAKLKKSILRKLGDLGETHDVTPIADTLVKYARGEKLSSSDIKTLNNSDYGYKVMNGLNAENIKSGNLSDKWAEKIGTKRINPEVYNKDLYDLASEMSGLREATEKGSVAKTLAESKIPTEDKLEVSESGKTIYKKSDGSTEDVTVKRVVSTEGGLKVELDNGKNVSVKDLSFSTSEEAMMYEMVARMEVTPETANEIIGSFKPINSKQASMYFMAVPLAYQYGKMNYEAGLKNISLSEQQKRIAFNRGRMDAMTKAKSQPTVSTQKANPQKETTAPKSGIIYENGFTYDEATANELQKKSMIGIEVIDKMSNLEVHVFESKVVNGKRVAYVSGKLVKAPNGYFTNGNKIYIDINAGNGGEGAMLYTMSHEVAHYIRKWNAKGFKELGDFLISEYGKKGVGVEGLLRDQKEKIEKRYKEEKKTLPSEAKLADMAYEELVADAMSDMFTDPKAYEKLANLKKKNFKVWQKLGEAIKSFLDKLKTALGIYRTKDVAVAQEAMLVRGFSADVYEKLQDLYLKAFVEADANYEAFGSEATDLDGNKSEYLLSDKSMVEGAGLQFVLNENGVDYKVLDKNGKPVKSVTAEMIVDSPLGNLVTMAKNEGYLGKGKEATLAANKQYQFLADLVNMCINYNGLAPIWETAGTMVFSSMKSNADKQYGLTIDFSTVCKKTQAIVDAMSEAMLRLGRGLTRSEVETIYLEVGKAGESTPCPVCYVFSRWMGIGGILDQISRFQDKYTNMSEESLQSFIADIKQRIDERANTPGKNGKVKAAFFNAKGEISEGQVIADLKSKASSKAASALKAIANNSNIKLQIQELEAMMKNQDSKEAKKTAKKIETLKKKLSDVSALEKEMHDANDTLEEYEAYQWLTRTLMTESNGKWVKNSAFKPVPKDILFDLNKGDKFAEGYPLSWAFRTGKGASAGKAIVPYADARVGEAIQAVASGSPKDIKIGLELNPFLNSDTKGRLKILKSAIEKQARQNLVGGQRYQSTSDFRYEYGSDYLITFLEMQAIGAKVQLYTKVIEAVDFLASMGADCNLSVMPLSDGFITLPDGTKKLVYSSVTGINAEAAIQKAHEYNNVQLILVGISDEHIRLALEGMDVTFVIPFHGSGNSVHQIQALMNLLGENLDVTTAQDYTAVQSDHVSPNQTKEQKAMWNLRVKIVKGEASKITSAEQALLDKNPYLKDLYRRFYIDSKADEYGVGLTSGQAEQIFPYEYWDKSLTYAEADQNGDRFKEYCASMGIIPRFSGMNSKGENVGFGDFSNDKGYWKLLIDRPMYDNTYDSKGNWTGYGKYHEQARINCSNFNVKHLDPEYGSATYGEVMSKANDPKKTNKIVDAALKQFENNDLNDVRNSDRDSHKEAAIEEFGTTNDFARTGFVTDDGRMLNLSQYGLSGVQHRIIERVFDGVKGEEAIAQFIQEGNVRIKESSPGIEISADTALTTNQLNVVSRFISSSLKKRGVFYLDITDAEGNEVASVTYDNRDSAESILFDIKDYYKRGTIPEEKGYYYSDRDSTYLDAVNRGDMETAQRMVDEAAKNAGYNSPKLYHGTKMFGFTEVKTSGVEKGVDWSPFFAANKEDISASYVPYGKVRDISSSMDDDAIEEARENAIEERKENIINLVDDFRRLIDRHFSPWVFGQTDNSYLESLVEEANPEAGYGDGVYDVLSEIVYNSFYDYQDEFGEYEDADDWSENSPEGNEIFYKITEIEGEKSALHRLESGEELGGIYQLYANLNNMYVVDGKGAAWNEIRPEGLPKIDRYGVKDVAYRTRDVADWARENGYDGVIFKNIRDNGAYGRTPAGDVYAFFRPESQVKSADPVTYDDNGNVIPLSERFNTENSDIRYDDRDGNVKRATELSEEDLKYLLEGVQNGVYPNSSYIPLRRNTPEFFIGVVKEHSKGKYFIEDYPMASTVEHLRQNMEEDDGESHGNHRPHGLSIEDIITISREMGDPSYIVLQENGRYAEVVSFYNKRNKKVVVAIDVADSRATSSNNYKYRQYMNGYNEGYYNIIVTQFEPDSLEKYLEKNTVVYDKIKMNGSYQVGSGRIVTVTHDTPFIEDRIPQTEENVNREFSDTDEMHSERDPNSVSNRTLLANALDSIAQNDIEKNKLAQYKNKIALIESEQKKLAEIRAKANELRFTKGRTPSETKQMRDLDFEATQTANRINTYDKQLLNLESTSALKNVLEREKTLLRKRLEQKGKEALKKQKEKDAATVRELMTRHTESRAKAVESRNKTAMRHKIKGIVSDLNKLLLNPTKDQHVPIGLQKVVAEALDAINMDTMNAEERVAYYNDLISKSTDPNEIEMLKKKRDFFEYRDANFKDRITALKNAYAEFKESDDPLIRNAHNEAIENLIRNTADEIGNKSLKDMSLAQLESVYDMYKAILATVRNSNKMFKEGRQATVSENSEAVKTEVKEVGGHQDRIRKATKGIKSFTWNLLKPIYALQRIGSKTLTGLFENVRVGEDTYATDIYEAREFFQDKTKKYNYDSWDFKKKHNFKDSAGNNFTLSLEQIMSLYAYSKREQADKHLEFGGFVFDDTIEVTEKNKLGIPIKYEVNDANPYRLRAEDLASVTSTLTADQKAFIDDMQTYLSDVMGAKGNEISLAMYDIKMFKEKYYFPLKTSKYFREYNPEQTGNPMLRNSGFTKKTVPQAGNPIVLANFMDVWTSHVNDMSMYHSFVLPLEDFMRVYNYSSTAGGYDSVQQYIKNAYGAEANQYVEKLMQDINGGVMSGNIHNGWLKMFGKFKKAAVAASLSTIVQQPTAVIRAMAIINPKYFVGIPFKGGHKDTWNEIKRYAPVAIIKEMGGFDVEFGGQARDYITSQTYKGLGKIKGFFTDSSYRDSVFMWGATKADELGWNSIWRAVKKEVASTQNLKPGTEEFFKACGKRFTEVVTQTQVYDSVFSRSGMMRDKGDLNKFATAFMGEPTTSFNMIYNAILKAKRGGSKAEMVGTISSVYVSIVSAAALASLIYALRDDDEDEAYLEKFANAFGKKLSSEIWIHNMIPYVRDIASMIEGWDVERPDMSIFSDIKSSFDQLFKINDEGEFEWKVDFSDPKSVYVAIENFGGNIASAFGLPLRNLMRDTRGIYNGIEAMFDDIHPMYVGDAFVEGLTGDEKKKSEKLYNAIVNSDEGRLKIYRGGYKTDASYETAVKSALREHDPRIKEAAQAVIDGKHSERIRLTKEIVAEGNFPQDFVVSAINSEITALRKKEKDKKK